jgi:poly(ADP-ribose) glycohydrolase ARH3
MLEQNFVGCLLGLAVGDALGSHYEGQTPDWIGQRFSSTKSLFDNLPEAPWSYTDDTQMAIGVAESLLKDGAIIEQSLCAAFVENYDPSRGYGRGARVVLNAMAAGEDHKFWANELFPGGSYGNGAAMRVAPVGLMFHDDLQQVRDQARLSSLPTHTHPLGIEGAQLLAVAVALCLEGSQVNKEDFFAKLKQIAIHPEYQEKLDRAQHAQDLDDVRLLGNGIAAQDSVVTAIACFALTPDSFEQVVGNAILLGGDTDTIAAMAGSLAGASLGEAAIPQFLLEALEDDHKGRTYIAELGRQLYACCISLMRTKPS